MKRDFASLEPPKTEIYPTLPHNKEAERAILGAILVASANTDAALQLLEPSDFFLPFHQVVFRHLKNLHSQGKPTSDLVLLHTSIEESNELENAGGSAFIASLIDGVPRIPNPDHYAEIVKTKAQARYAIRRFQSRIDRILQANGDLEAVLQEISVDSAPLYVKYGQEISDPFKTA